MIHAPSPHALTGRPLEALTLVLVGTPYRAVGFLGRGTTGEVWVVEHVLTARQLALKVIHPKTARCAARLRAEVATVGRRTHPHTVELVDFWVAVDGRPCIVTELLHGRTLGEELGERHRLPPAEAFSIIIQVLNALDATHELGVVHGDLHLDNIYLHHGRDDARIVKVLDFGVACALREGLLHAAPTERDNIAVAGSPQFMSPEAWSGAGVDARADLFSTGVILYMMLAGRGPFDEGEAQPVPPSSHSLAPLSAQLDSAILKAIEEDRSCRHQSARAFLAALGASGRSGAGALRC